MFFRKQPDFGQLLRELGAFSRRDVTQGLKLAKYKKSAQALLKKDPVSGHVLHGLVACLEHDIASMHAQYLQAVELSDSYLSLMYYALALEKSCLWNDAAKYALLALDRAPQEPKLLNAAIGIAPLTGRFSLLKKLLSQWQESHEGVRHPRQDDYETVTETLARQGLAEQDLKAVLAGIGTAFSETDAILLQCRYELVSGKDSSFIHYRFVLPDSLVATYYEDRVSEKLTTVPCHPRIFDAFSFSVENGTVYDLYDCMERELASSADTIKVPDPDKMKLIEELIRDVEV
ncbi:hypothetical protein KP003_08890 [Geomonas nitrogeniifigens]|uniref:Uncharacterized protein n=1 Tax=Geomonas diazotrophica TaxID=2843197 RepID=A0ABX8JLU1_9BACT|nr:hypothetical protein [Geomonas nitrogeniifigens]QWV99325.1 hypothetical protein KP005_08640 [Geomonas nitrogeniifigens]QXE88492.1 hypothetical protein KP003_08890 [Geomonas nitrogeniifigens]